MNTHLRKTLPLAGLAAAALLLSSCASGPKVFANASPEARFAEYASYRYQEPLGTDQEKYRSILSNVLIQSVDSQLQARGYTRSDEADLIVNFETTSKETLKSGGGTSFGGSFGIGSGGRSGFGISTSIGRGLNQKTENTVFVHLIDAGQEQLVWEGIIEGQLTENDKDAMAPLVRDSVAKLFAKFPYTAAGYSPASTTGASR